MLPVLCWTLWMKLQSFFIFKPPHDKTNKMVCALPSLIRVFAVCYKGSWRPTVSSCAQQRIGSDWADARADISLCWAHTPLCSFCHKAALFVMFVYFCGWLVLSGIVLTSLRSRERVGCIVFVGLSRAAVCRTLFPLRHAIFCDFVSSLTSRLLFCYITKTCLYNVYPFKLHFYIVKLGFTGVYVILLISAQKQIVGTR